MKKIEPPSALTPTPWEPADATALQALANGTADSGQQQRALNWIIYKATGVYDVDYRPDEREHCVMAGKRMVGLEIIKMLKLNVGAIVGAKKKMTEQGL